MKPFKNDDPRELKRQKNEIQILERVRNPLIIQVIGVVQESPSKLHILMEYFPSWSLHEVNLKKVTDLSLEDKHQIFQTFFAAIQYLHSDLGGKRTVVHADIKPSNILLGKDKIDGKFVLKICDFGLAILKNTDTTQIKSTVASGAGTPFYMAPELHLNNAKASIHTDVWAIGVTLKEIYGMQRA